MTPDTKAEGFVAGTRKIVQFLRYGPRELALALLGLLLLGAIPLLPKLAEWLPIVAPALPWMTGVLAVLGLLLLGFSIRRIWKKAVAPLPEGKPKPAAIKGPAPFGPQDAELFARLGRNDDLNKLRDWILDDQKPLVALMGESGVGKTSLLRAGLAHHLQDDKVPVLYWEALPTDPEAKLLHAVRVGWEDEEKAPKTFEELASSVASGRRVVVIDQAEQLSPEGHPRIFELLRQVAEGNPPYKATWVVAFRREFLPVWRDFELSLPEVVQRRMETLSLRLFLPKAAEKVIAVLAEEGSVPADQKLVEKIVEDVAIEGKISPADIGISLLVLSEVAGGRPAGSLSLNDFRESGGQAGLLTRYLERLLERLPEAERSEVLRGLLALIDLEKHQRLAEGRTLGELEEAVKPASAQRFAEALRFLASGKARVLEELPGEPVPYRLVHERLIPAIRKLTGVILVEVERASLALERGYRVWAQARRSQYLLHGKDLEEVRRFRNQIRWGKEEEDKREFVRLSTWRRAAQRLTLVAAGLVMWFLIDSLGHYSQRRENQSLLETWGLPRDLYNHLDQLEDLTLPGTVTRVDWLRNASRLKTLTIEDGSLASLRGLPDELETLKVGKSRLVDLYGLPHSLRFLSLGPNQIARFESIPRDLRILDLDLTHEPSWDSALLPNSLVALRLVTREALEVDFRKLTSLRSLSLRSDRAGEISCGNSLPKGLRSLSLWEYNMESFAEVPRGLVSFSFATTREQPPFSGLPKTLSKLALMLQWEDDDSTKVVTPFLTRSDLPSLRSLTLVLPSSGALSLDLARVTASPDSLALMSNGGLWIQGLPQGIGSLRIIADWVLLSEELPHELTRLELPAQVLIDGRQDTWQSLIGKSEMGDWWDLMGRRLAHFPTALVSLAIVQPRGSRFESVMLGEMPALSQLPKLEQLRSLKLNNAGISQIPAALSNLTVLNLRGEQITELPNLQSLIKLDISETPLQSLAGLPPRLRSLSLGTNQVMSLDGLPLGVTALHFHGANFSERAVAW